VGHKGSSGLTPWRVRDIKVMADSVALWRGLQTLLKNSPDDRSLWSRLSMLL
jgi:hypothetical protein